LDDIIDDLTAFYTENEENLNKIFADRVVEHPAPGDILPLVKGDIPTLG